MSKFCINEIVNIFPKDKKLQHLLYSKGIIRNKLNNNYLVYLCYDGELVELQECELTAVGTFAKLPKFNFFEIVIAEDKFLKITGFVIGKSQNEVGEWHYAVFLFDKQESCGFEEYELESTGQFVKKEDYYSGESVKVIVHPDGRGELKEE